MNDLEFLIDLNCISPGFYYMVLRPKNLSQIGTQIDEILSAPKGAIRYDAKSGATKTDGSQGIAKLSVPFSLDHLGRAIGEETKPFGTARDDVNNREVSKPISSGLSGQRCSTFF